MNCPNAALFSNIHINQSVFNGIVFPADSTLIVELKNGKREGKGIVLSGYKIRLAQLNFRHDVLNGLCVFYDSDGIKIKEAMYENDQHNGWGCEYKDDEKVYEGLYENGEKVSELRKYIPDESFTEEVKDDQTLSVCKFNENHQRDGLCYYWENNVMTRVVFYQNGKQKRIVMKFKDDEMTEFDDNDQVIYKGEYNGDISSGFKRSGNGIVLKRTSNGVVNEVLKMKNEDIVGRCVLDGRVMEEYKGEKLVYKGEYCWKASNVLRNGQGRVYLSDTETIFALFKKGEEKKRIQHINGEVLSDYDEFGRIVYKGEYETQSESCVRSGKGLIFIYDPSSLKDIYESKNGEQTVKRASFENSKMIELNDDGYVIYRGGYVGSPQEGFVRSGNGMEFDGYDELKYSGNWEQGKKEGYGKYYQDNGIRYMGEWKGDSPNGFGKLYNTSGELTQKGEWRDGDLMISSTEWLDYQSGLVKKEVVIKSESQLRTILDDNNLKQSIKNLVFASNVGDSWRGSLELCSFENLEVIQVRRQSFRNISMLRIANNPKLKTIVTEDGEYQTGAFYAAGSVVLESLMIVK